MNEGQVMGKTTFERMATIAIERADMIEELHRLLEQRLQSEGLLVELLSAITAHGRYSAIHLQAWAKKLEDDQRYESVLTHWLVQVAEALTTFEEAIKDETCAKER